MGHPLFKCWKRLDAKCSQCNQLRHEIVICKNKIQQHNEEAKATDQEEEDHLFVGTCFSSEVSNENWLIDSGCTNHVTYNKGLFKELNKTITTKVRVGNGAFIIVLGKGTVAIPTCLGTKLLHDVLYVWDINQNLLSVGQLIEKGNKVVVEDKYYLIKDVDDQTCKT